MTGPLGNSDFCFPRINVFRDEVEGNIEILGKQNSLFPSHGMLGWFSVAHKEKQEIILDIKVRCC